MIAALELVVPSLAAAGPARQIKWADLMPAANASAKDGSSLVTELDGQKISLSGYLLPADREGELVYAFMLVSRPGACSHNTQPPANQVIRVVPATPYRLRSNYEPVTISGSVTPGLEKTQMFILDGAAIIQSGYSVHRADVRPLRKTPVSNPPSPINPWQPLTNGEKRVTQPLPDAPESLSRTR